MTFWRSFINATLIKNPISSFAVLCVAATGIYLGVLTNRMVGVLDSPDWCGRAVQAEKIVPSNTFQGLTTCNELLKIQLQSLATGLHISLGTFGMTLLVLVVVVIAGAKASFKVDDTGISGDVSRDAPQAAQAVADSAQNTADTIKDVAP